MHKDESYIELCFARFVEPRIRGGLQNDVPNTAQRGEVVRTRAKFYQDKARGLSVDSDRGGIGDRRNGTGGRHRTQLGRKLGRRRQSKLSDDDGRSWDLRGELEGWKMLGFCSRNTRFLCTTTNKRI